MTWFAPPAGPLMPPDPRITAFEDFLDRIVPTPREDAVLFDIARFPDGELELIFGASDLDEQDELNRVGFESTYGFPLHWALTAVLTGHTPGAFLDVMPTIDDEVLSAEPAPDDPFDLQAVRVPRRESLRIWRVPPPVDRSVVNAILETHHRHVGRVSGWRFILTAWNGPWLVGLAVVGNPRAPALQPRRNPRWARGRAGVPRWLSNPRGEIVAEVNRVVTWGHPELRRNAASALYAESARQALADGFDTLVTYTLADEEGAGSVRAVEGFRADAFVPPTGKPEAVRWSRSGRERETPTPDNPKIRWKMRLMTPAERRRHRTSPDAAADAAREASVERQWLAWLTEQGGDRPALLRAALLLRRPSRFDEAPKILHG